LTNAFDVFPFKSNLLFFLYYIILQQPLVRLLRRIVRYMHHPIRRLRAELVLAYYDGKISRDELIKLYEQTEYVFGAPDVKRNNGLDVLARAAPQTHTHGG